MSNTPLYIRMATDMEIALPFDEHINTTKSRIIYSAIGEWIKASAYDTDIKEDDCEVTDEIRATKNHITRKCGKILAAYLDLYPDIKDWYYPTLVNETFNPVTEIRNRQLAAGVLVSGVENSLQFPQEKCTKIADNLYLYRGDTFHKRSQVIGLGNYIYTPDQVPIISIEDMYLIPSISAKEYVERYVQKVWNKFIKSENTPDTRKYFDYLSTRAFSESWVSSYPKNGKLTVYKDNELDYGLARIDMGELYTLAFPQAVIETQDVRRFIYGIRKIEQNPAQATIKDMGSMVQLTLPSYLPDFEQNFLYMLAWPKRNILDRIEYISEKILLPVIKKLLENLNIKVKTND
ncbi:hypothetical protein [Methanosarcina mazei]|uniref:Uncharacterized protein n=1 Tax=Methanosarcina mazei TaxID=2209 RepID=A0A0F8I2A4_METMZ|nr:hypothetical protein [Methanosarcina mazei]KKG83061.1 hypothetical protein DU55_08155 [Methanosarcina mazei]